MGGLSRALYTTSPERVHVYCLVKEYSYEKESFYFFTDLDTLYKEWDKKEIDGYSMIIKDVFENVDLESLAKGLGVSTGEIKLFPKEKLFSSSDHTIIEHISKKMEVVGLLRDFNILLEEAEFRAGER